MPLFTCPDCNRDVSTNASSCPNCGNDNFYIPIGQAYKDDCDRCSGKGKIPDSVGLHHGNTTVFYSKCNYCKGSGKRDFKDHKNLKDGGIYKIAL